tara:strand:+ start:1941 stop:2267 length:327 start_codon:yes stop_codon:yes gene_type:complete
MFFTIKILKNDYSFTKKEIIFYLFINLLLFFMLGNEIFFFIILFDLYIFTFKKHFIFQKNNISKIKNPKITSNPQKRKINLEFITEGKYSENEENLSKLVNEYTKKLL